MTVTVTGTNDKPTIAAGDTTATGAITELACQTGDSADQDQVSGTNAFKDVDLDDTHTVSQAAPCFTWSGGELTDAQKAALADHPLTRSGRRVVPAQRVRAIGAAVGTRHRDHVPRVPAKHESGSVTCARTTIAGSQFSSRCSRW